MANLPHTQRPRISIPNEIVRAVKKLILEDRPETSKFQAEIHTQAPLQKYDEEGDNILGLIFTTDEICVVYFIPQSKRASME